MPDGALAKLLLFDQLARNCFRGTSRAFAYDDKALAIAQALAGDEVLVGPYAYDLTYIMSSPPCIPLTRLNLSTVPWRGRA